MDKHQRKRKAEDSPEGGSRGRMQRPFPSPHGMDWAHRPVPVSNYDVVQRAQHGRPAHQGLSSPNGKSRSPQSHKVWASHTCTGVPSKLIMHSIRIVPEQTLFRHTAGGVATVSISQEHCVERTVTAKELLQQSATRSHLRVFVDCRVTAMPALPC